MADEQAPQLPPGAVPFTDVLSGIQSPLARSGQETMLSRAYKAFAEPATNLVSKIAPASPFQNPLTFDPTYGTRAVAEAVIPQTPVDAAIDAATLGAGKWIRPASKILGAGLRAGATAAAGGLAGAVSDEGPVLGTIKGLAAGTLSEGLAAGVYRLWKTGTERVTALQQAQDAKATGEMIDQLPSLKGVFQGQRTPEQLYDLAYGAGKTAKGQEVGKGMAMLKNAQDTAEGQIGQILSTQQQQSGRKFLYPDAMNPGKFTPWEESRKALSELGDLSRRLKPQQTTVIGGKEYNGGEVKQLFAENMRTFQSQLGLADPSGKAVSLFNDSRAQYAAGIKTLAMLQEAFKHGADPERIVFNTRAIQKWLGRNQSSVSKAFGDQGLEQVNNLIFRGQGPGYVDSYAPSGMLSSITGGLPIPGGGFLREGLGNTLGMPRLVGNPRAVSQPVERALRLGAAQGANTGIGAFSGYTPNLTGGIPGLK